MTIHTNNRTIPGLFILFSIILALYLVIKKHDQSSGVYENWIEGWRTVASFSIPRRAPAAIVAADHIYIMGGVDDRGNYVQTVEFAPIEPDGNLGEWRNTTALLEGRFYLASATDGQYLYALGGGGGPIGDDNIPLASVERAIILPDGSLGKWQHHSYLTTPRRGLKTEQVDGHIYAIGGYNGTFLRSSERLSEDSAPQWILEKQEALVDRYIHATAQINNQLYLLGGHVEKAGKMSYGDIETTRVNSSGTLEPWRTSPSLLVNARFIATAFAIEKYLFIAGGHDGVQRLNSVEMSRINYSGDPGVWSLVSPMKTKRSAAASAVFNNRVYVLGGMDNNGALNTVETAILGPGGRLGHLAQQ